MHTVGISSSHPIESNPYSNHKRLQGGVQGQWLHLYAEEVASIRTLYCRHL